MSAAELQAEAAAAAAVAAKTSQHVAEAIAQREQARAALVAGQGALREAQLALDRLPAPDAGEDAPPDVDLADRRANAQADVDDAKRRVNEAAHRYEQAVAIVEDALKRDADAEIHASMAARAAEIATAAAKAREAELARAEEEVAARSVVKLPAAEAHRATQNVTLLMKINRISVADEAALAGWPWRYARRSKIVPVATFSTKRKHSTYTDGLKQDSVGTALASFETAHLRKTHLQANGFSLMDFTAAPYCEYAHTTGCQGISKARVQITAFNAFHHTQRDDIRGVFHLATPAEVNAIRTAERHRAKEARKDIYDKVHKLATEVASKTPYAGVASELQGLVPLVQDVLHYFNHPAIEILNPRALDIQLLYWWTLEDGKFVPHQKWLVDGTEHASKEKSITLDLPFFASDGDHDSGSCTMNVTFTLSTDM